jgi:hypothetical protein
MQKSALRPPAGDLLGKLVLIMKDGISVPAEERHQQLLEVLRAAGPDQIAALLSAPEELALASGCVHSVLDELDERRAPAAAEARAAAGRAGPMIVGWPR